MRNVLDYIFTHKTDLFITIVLISLLWDWTIGDYISKKYGRDE